VVDLGTGGASRSGRSNLPAIEARGLFAFHAADTGTVVALQGVSLAVQAGEFVALLGPSGAGKSTLMRCLAGSKQPHAGELVSFGASLHNRPEGFLARWRARHVGVVDQHYARALSPALTVLQIACLPGLLRGMPRRETVGRATALLERAGIGARLDASRAELSGGEQQRVALCAALVPRPSLLLLDEVTGELDAQTGARVLSLLRTLAAEQAIAVVLATHDLNAARAADRAVTMRDGRITAELSRDGVRTAAVDESGILRLDPRDLEAAGIRGQARLEVRAAELVLRPHRSSLPRVSATATVISRAETPNVGGTSVACDSGSPPASGRQPTIELQGVTKRYGRGRGSIQALTAIDLSVAGSGLHALVAPSGSGKTTLLHLIAGLLRPTDGHIDVAGHSLNDLSREQLAAFRQKAVAVVAQASQLVPHLSARDNVGVALFVRGRDEDGAISTALANVGLADKIDRRADQLSSGERQRVAIARALATACPIVLVDEPTANLDERTATSIARLLAQTARTNELLILCATHDPTVTAEAVDVIKLESTPNLKEA
jgi:ABC-type lipoprotein export system ATPase subunit